MKLQWLRNRIEAWKDYPLREGLFVGKGRYRIEQCIGMGSYGITYRATDTQTGTSCLLKQHKPSKGQLAVKLLRREAEHMNLIQHPRIPRCLDMWEEKGKSFLVMDFIDGLNVEQLLDNDQTSFTEAEALGICKQIASLIMEVHRAGLIHMDVRIPNVLIHEKQVYLIDFGLSRRYGEERKQSEQGGGFVGRSSSLDASKSSGDEFKQRMRKIHPSSDWYALGHFLLFLLYSAYTEEEGAEERSWTDELHLHPATVQLLHTLLEPSEYADELYFAQLERAHDVVVAS